jgi:DNA-binding protein HU-beta
LNKSELIDTVAGSTGETKRAVSDVIEATLNTIQKQVKKGDKVTIPGFGTFSRRNRAARTARNPRTGEEIKVKASRVPAFKAGAGFKTFVSGK